MYRARRPFHPHRLWDLVSQPFAVIQTTYEDDGDSDDGSDEDGDSYSDDDMDCKRSDNVTESEESSNREAVESAAKIEVMRAEKEELDLPARAKFKRESPVWKGLMRSKGEFGAMYPAHSGAQRDSSLRQLSTGFVWLATRNQVHGEWSQAGVRIMAFAGNFTGRRCHFRSCSP